MRKEEKKLELRVGLFVMAGVTLAMAAILVLGGKQSLFSSTNSYYTHFPKVDGLVAGAKVVLGGLQIGNVKEVDFDDQTRDVRVRFDVQRKYAKWIRRDSAVEIVTQGVLGDKYLSLKAGELTEPEVPNKGEIPVGASKDLSNLLSSSEQLMQKLTSTADNLDRVLSAFNRGGRADQFFAGLAGTSKNLSDISAKLNDDVVGTKLKSAVTHLNSILEKIDRGQGSVGALINNPGLYDDAKALVGQVNRNRIMRNLVRKTIRDNKESAEDAVEDGEKK